MYTLFLNLASHEGLLALATEDAVTSSIAVPSRIDDRQLIASIEQLLTHADLRYGDIQRIACVAGPGGFMTIRGAVTCANALADQLTVPLAAIHESDVLFAAADSKRQLTWLHSTRKTHLFVRTKHVEHSPWNEPTLVSVEELRAAHHLLPSSYCGELIEEHRPLAEGMTAAAAHPIEDILPSFLSSLTYESGPIEPWYGRGW